MKTQSKIKALNSNVVVKRMQAVRETMIHLPDEMVQRTFYATVLSCGSDVTQLNNGYVCLFESRDKANVGDNIYIFDQYDALLVRTGNIYRPIGNRVLVKRKLFERKLDSGIIIPDCYQTVGQSKDCIVYYAGINNRNIIDIENDWGLKTGDEIVLDGWKNEHKEIEINGEYFLSVRLKDILYVVNN